MSSILNAGLNNFPTTDMIIRWSRLIPRLLILAVLLFAAWYFRDGLLRWQVQSNVESQTGASVEIDAVRSDLKTGTVVFENLSLADPKESNRELIRIEKIVTRVSTRDILLRYFRFPEIRLEGVKVSVDGVDSGELIPDKLWSKFKDRIPREAITIGQLDWISLLSEKPEDAAKNLVKQFETGRLADDIAKRWPTELQQFERSVASIKERFQKIKELGTQNGRAEDKFLLINEMLKELENADSGIQQLIAGVAGLKNKAQLDYQSLLNASQRDRASLKTLQAPQLDTRQISETLIGPEIREQWDKTLAWSDWASSLMIPPETDKGVTSIYGRFGLEPPQRFSGETIHLALLDAKPDFLVDTMDMTGQILFGTIPVYFNGKVRNIAHSMSLGPEPMLAQFCFSGSGIPPSPILPEGDGVVAAQVPAVMDPSIVPNIYVTLRMDRIGGNQDDQMIVRCPMYQLPERILGEQDKFAIVVSPGMTALDGVLLSRGENISGEIRIAQAGVRLELRLPEKHRQSTLHRLLQQTLDSLDGFTAKILVNGTRSEPVYAFQSDIADRIAPQIETLIRSEWDAIRQTAEGKVVEEANQAVAMLNTAVRDKLDPVLNEIGTQRNLWEQQIAQGSGLPVGQLIQSNLSPQDQQRLNQFLSKPAVQSLLQASQTGATGTGQQLPSTQQIDGAIQQGVDKIQEKLPGLLDKLRKR